MKINRSILFFTLLLASCQSKQIEKSSADTARPAATKIDSANPLPVDFKFSLYISAIGGRNKQPDSWTIDTSGTIAVHTSPMSSQGKYQDLTAMAALDPGDMDSLRMLIRNGRLYAIDSNDLNQQCAGDEHYTLKIVPHAATPSLSLGFDACAADYNLLLEPQRHYFRRFIDWWERMRIKYRPNQSE
jgi:hypothetical protein